MAYSFVKAVAAGTLFLAFAAQGSKVDVTPIQKVVSLLGGLAEKIAAEGKKEAAQYDKVACFCKEQATEKQMAIDSSNAMVELNGATEGRLTIQITGFTNSVGKLTQDVATKKGEITTKTEARSEEHAAYIKEAYEVAKAVQDCENALRAIEDHLKKQKKVESASLVQVTLEKDTAAATVLSLLKDSTRAPNLGYDATYQILISMKKFVSDFKEQAAKIDADEGRAKYLSDSAILAEQNEITFSTKEIRQTQEQVNRQTADLEGSKEASAQATKDKESDEKFLKELTSGCENKAGLFRRRGETRSGELTAIATAMTKLKEGGAAPKQAAQLEMSSHVVKRHSKVRSFLQINREVGQAAAVDKARSFIAQAADANSNSVALRNLAIRLQVSGDHFVKVRKLVQDMIAKLESDASQEQTKKGFCDKGIKKNTGDRDDAQMEIEDSTSQVAKKTAEAEMLQEGIATATKELAELRKALLENTELRAEEKANNEATIKVAKEAAAGVDLALGVLNSFYNQASLVQQAPKMAEGEYTGAQDSAKGIVGMLEVCKSDFERKLASTMKEEEDAAEEFETGFKTETNAAIESKSKTMEEKKASLVEAKADMVTMKADLGDSKTRSAVALEALDKMREDCGLDGESADSRNKARMAEIESLKSAQDILDNWKSD